METTILGHYAKREPLVICLAQAMKYTPTVGVEETRKAFLNITASCGYMKAIVR